MSRWVVPSYNQIREKTKWGSSVGVRVPLDHVRGDVTEQMAKAAQTARGLSGEWLRSGTVEFFMDGVPANQTALMDGGHENRPGWYGEVRFDPDIFCTLCIKAGPHGPQIAVHWIGDGAAQHALDT